MNTVLSDKAVKELQKKGTPYTRKVLRHTQKFQTTPDKLFPLLCPTTEFDWMDGWHCELIYSQSHYHEYNAIFKTDYFIPNETWVISHFEANRIIEFVRVSEHLSVKVDARLCDNLNGTTTGTWIVNATALTPQGNQALENMNPDDEPIGILLDALDYYINNDKIKPLPEGIFNKK
ncbi:hypothetical protein [uncultured Tenacibaculum sp.]|uniref:hypothetical protein n=1 Tax=uncultured Tenacibaculum sp. TaxID=174713 RepID=UPI00261B2046|nr:hypothetical protein [uncultured Tenacibaculum sp.]